MVRRLGCWSGTLFAIVLGLGFVFGGAIRWSGGWDQAEFRFTFLDSEGRPVEGVELRVEDAAGNTFWHFPITDYLPDRIPTSGPDGCLVFHHAPSSYLGGSEHRWFGLIVIYESPLPDYVCRFVLRGQEVHRVRYHPIANAGRDKVRRPWKWATAEEVHRHVFQGLLLADPALWLRPFDHDGDGKLDIQELYARRAAEQAWERALDIQAGRKPALEELEFSLVERTVVVDRP